MPLGLILRLWDTVMLGTVYCLCPRFSEGGRLLIALCLGTPIEVARLLAVLYLGIASETEGCMLLYLCLRTPKTHVERLLLSVPRGHLQICGYFLLPRVQRHSLKRGVE